MSEFDLQPVDAPAAPAEPQQGFDLQPVETAPAEGDNLGVYPLGDRAGHMAVLDEIRANPVKLFSYQVDEIRTNPVKLVSYQAMRGPAAEAATKAIALAKDTGLSPQFAADNADELQRARDQAQYESYLGVGPLAAYASQSPVHAAAVKDDVKPLQALEQGLMDLGYQVIATANMSIPTEAAEEILQNYETDTAAYQKRDSGIIANLARDVPSLAAYYLAGTLGKARGGKLGEVGATAGLMFGLNRGQLYRRILAATPDPDEQAMRYTLETGKDVSDEEYAGFVKAADDFKQRARLYATAGAAGSAAIGAGLASVASLAVNGGARKLQAASNEIVARLFTDPTVQRLTLATGHTIAGTLAMVVPAIVDDAAVQKAAAGTVDFGKLVEAGTAAAKHAWLAAATLSTLPHVPGLIGDIGRAVRAPVDAARLDHLVETARQSKLAQRSPEEAQALIRDMSAGGDASTVYVAPEAAAQPEAARKLVEALADEGRSLAQAQASGTDLAVPTEKYLTVVAPEFHDALREHVKLDPNGSTVAEAQDFLAGPVAKLLAERSEAQALPVGEERTTKLADIHDRMRQAVSDQYGGAPEDWDKALNGHAVEMLSGAVNGTPRLTESVSSDDAVRSARQWTEQGTIGDLNPGRYGRAAKVASDKLAAIATESAEGGQAAARQGFVGAAMQKLRGFSEKSAGVENLKEAGKKADTAAKQLAEIPALEQARDLARAQAKVHEEVQAEMQKGRDYLAKRDTDTFRAELAKASPEYLNAFNAIQDAIDENTPRAPARPQALDALLLRMENDAEPVGSWADAMRGILEEPRGWKALRPTEARAVVDMAKNLRAAARRQNDIELADRKFTLRERVSEVRAHLDALKVPGGELPAPSRASQGLFEKAAETVGEMATEELQPREILRRLGMLDVYHAFVTARNAKEELARKVGEDVWRMYERDMPAGLKKTRTDLVQGPGSPVLNDAKWTRQDLWEFTSWWGSESGSDRIKRGLRITDGRAFDFMSQLTNAEVDFINAKSKLNDEVLWPLIRDHQVAVTGIAPPKIEAQPFTIHTAEGDVREVRGGYEPARYRRDQDSTAPAPENAQTIADYWGNLRDDFPSTARYFLKERVQNVQRVPDLNWSTYSSHVGSVLHYLAYDDFIRNAGRIFRDQEFRKLVQQRPALGPQAMKELDKFLSVSARGQVDAAKGGAERWNQIIGGGTRVLGTALFKSNPVIAFGDLAHVPGSALTLKLGPRDLLYGLSEALQPNTWGASFDGSEQLPYRWNGYGMKLREQLSNIGPGDQPAGLRWRKWTDAVGWLPYHVADGFVSKVVFEAAASKAERNGASPKEARLAGDDAVAAVMPPLNPAERSSVARDRGLIGSLLLVRGFPNQLFNMAAMLKWDAQNRIWQSDPGWQRAKTALGVGTVAAASFLGVMWSEQLLGNFLMGHGKEQDESWAQWWERQMLSAPFYPIPIAGDVADVVAGAAVSHKPFKQELLYGHRSLRTAPALGLIGDAIKELGDVVDGRSDSDRMFGALKLASTVLGTGTYPMRPLRYSTDLMTDRAHPRGPFDVAGGFFYGKRPKQAKNPFTAIQDLVSGR